MWMQEGTSHVSTYTTKDELDGVEEWGGGGLYGRKNIYMHLPTLPRLSGMEGGGDCGEQIYLLLQTSVSPGPRKSFGSQLISFTISVPPVFLLTISTFDALYPFAATTPVIQNSFPFASASSSIDAVRSTEMVAYEVSVHVLDYTQFLYIS